MPDRGKAFGMRWRDAHLIPIDSEPALVVYDLERTFVFEPPTSLAGELSAWPPRAVSSGLNSWLIESDLLTTSARPDWREDQHASPPRITDVSLDLPGACNMGCTYCFEKPIFSRIGRMKPETLEAALDFAFAQAAGAKKISLHFGSGEPLIEFETLRQLVGKAQQRAAAAGQGIAFELTTNATLVTDEIAEFLAANPFNLRVSCDGPGEIHDRRRPMASGASSFHRVEKGLKVLLRYLPDRLTVNSVLCTEARLATLWQWAKDLGLRHYHVIKVGAADGADEELRAHDLEKFEEDLGVVSSEIFDALSVGDVPIDFQPLTKVVRRLMLPQPITRFCGVAGSYVGVASDGAVYPCFRHLGLEEYRLGSVFDGIDDAKRGQYRHEEAADVDSRPICKSCWARYMCGGGCYADSVVYGSDRRTPQINHCPFWRAEIAEGVRLYHRLRTSDPMLCLALFGDSLEGILDGSEPRFVEFRKTF